MPSIDELSATDRAFLDLEAQLLGMHVGAVIVLGPSDLVGDDGTLDTARLALVVGGGLARIPRFRQRAARVPGLGAAWVDDENFRLENHIHRAVVVRPGEDADLFELAGAIFSRPLEPDRPLWEIWLVEGLANGRFALIAKAHHALVDGIGGIAVLASIALPTPEDTQGLPFDWHPDPPTRAGLVRALSRTRVRHVSELVRELRDAAAAHRGAGCAGALHFGLYADDAVVHDLDAVSADFQAAFEELCELAGTSAA